MILRVRFLDGCLKEYENIAEWQSSDSHLWFMKEDKISRWLPLRNVRWWEPIEEEQEEIEEKVKECKGLGLGKCIREDELKEATQELYALYPDIDGYVVYKIAEETIENIRKGREKDVKDLTEYKERLAKSFSNNDNHTTVGECDT